MTDEAPKKRATAFGVVKELRAALNLPAGSTDQDVLDAALAAIAAAAKKAK